MFKCTFNLRFLSPMLACWWDFVEQLLLAIIYHIMGLSPHMHFRVLNTYVNIAHFISPTFMKQKYSPFHLIGSKAVIDTHVHNTQNVKIFFNNKRNGVQPSFLFLQIFFTWQNNKNPEWLIRRAFVEKMFFNDQILCNSSCG